jgi:CcmD family protein
MTLLENPEVAMYISLAVALAVWIGIFIYLWRLDALARDLRQKLDREQTERSPASTPTATLERRTPTENQPAISDQ